ncbi:MAG: HPP family protein [Oscillospiraceae bacterium]|nr:HPP family protein [Oscillospiraceae bacterium]
MRGFKWKNDVLALAMVIVMVGIAELFQCSALIFPEIAALTIGCWVMARQPWQVSSSSFIILMTLSAFVGVLLAHLSIIMPVQVALSFLFSALALMFTRSSITPIFSAGILPVLLQETNYIYVFAVCIMAAIVVLVRYFLVQAEWVRPFRFQPVRDSIEEQAHKWLFLLIGVIVFALIAYFLRLNYLIAPPLIVTFVEFFEPSSKYRRAPVPIWCLLTAGALIGTICRFLFSICFGLPLILSAAIALAALFIVFVWFRRFFPPAGAIAILPMVLPPDGILGYIPQVAIGAALLILCACYLPKLRRKQDTEWEWDEIMNDNDK